MKKRERGFLSQEFIDHNSEQFDYIAELHQYLWRFVKVFIPGASGDLENFLDAAITLAEQKQVSDEQNKGAKK